MSRLASVAFAGTLVTLVALMSASHGQSAGTFRRVAFPANHEMLADAYAVKWRPSTGLPPGASSAVITGDPAKSGQEFIVRLRLPDGYRIAPHWHPNDEHITVLSGTFLAGMGTEFDEHALVPLRVGGYMRMPARSPHFIMAKGETIVQLHGIGPFFTTFVNAAGEPLKE